jgi:NitT/TauT family transport system ATP-binding protein
MNDPVIEVRNLHARYGKREIVHDFSLSVNRGEFITILGRSGCGKSTMLNAIAGFIGSDGYVKIPENFGYIFQTFAVFPWLTVQGNIRFGLGPEITDCQATERLKSLLEMTGLTDDALKYPAELSGGQMQRVALARALAHDPEVLLMDEPFGSLDVYTREKMQRWLLELWERQKHTIVFVTHSIEEAILLSERILVMADGRIVETFSVPFPRPRPDFLEYEPEFLALRKRISSILEVN